MTAKELAKLLGVSEAAVSFALNNKPGVSTVTRNRIKEAAKKYNVDYRRESSTSSSGGVFYFIRYCRSGTILSDSSFFNVVSEGADDACARAGIRLNFINVYSTNQLRDSLEEMNSSDVRGIILLATEMLTEDFFPLAFCRIPIVLLDNHFPSFKYDSVQIGNEYGAYQATHYLMKKIETQPGYLHSSYPITNFGERERGFYGALHEHGYSKARTIVHELSPTVDGAYSDMLELLTNNEPIARGYFADNDSLAIGAMRAFREFGYRIPEDVAIIGFDDLPACTYIDPQLTTVHVPKHYMGYTAAERLISLCQSKDHYSTSIQISTHLVYRKSV